MDFSLVRLQRSGRNQIIQLLNATPAPWPEDFYGQLRNIFKDHQMVRRNLKGVGFKFCSEYTRTRQKLNSATQNDIDLLQRVADFLVVSPFEIVTYQNKIIRLKTLTDIRHGILPLITPLDLVLLKGETAHWQEPCKLLEERVVSRRYVGGSQGVSFRVAKGVSYRVGSYRGHMESKRGVIPVSNGILTITNKRVIFAGGSKSFNIPLQKMVGMNTQGNNRVLLTATTGNPRLLSLDNAVNLDIVQSILAMSLGNQR